MRLWRAKEPKLPDSMGWGPSGNPPLGASPDALGWVWSMISAGMWDGTIPALMPIVEADILAIPAVSASLALITSYATQMPLQAVEDAIEPAAVVDPTPPILRCPTGDPRATNLTLADWVESVIRDLALWGDYLGVLGPAAWDGWPRFLYPVPPWGWFSKYSGGRVVYTVGDTEYDPIDIFHVSINRSTGELRGRGLLSTHGDTVAAAVQAERWAARYFQGGGAPGLHISHPNPDLTQAQADDLKAKYVASNTAGPRGALITPVGTQIDVLPSDAESAQLVEARKWSNAALAIALGVQPAMLGLEGPSMTYRNIADVAQQLVSTTEMRYLVPVEQQLTAQCLPRGIRARFSTAALVRPDWGSRMTQALAGFSGGLLTNAEARAMLDLQPEPELENQPEPATDPALNPAEPGPSPVPLAAGDPAAMPPLQAIGG